MGLDRAEWGLIGIYGNGESDSILSWKERRYNRGGGGCGGGEGRRARSGGGSGEAAKRH